MVEEIRNRLVVFCICAEQLYVVYPTVICINCGLENYCVTVVPLLSEPSCAECLDRKIWSLNQIVLVVQYCFAFLISESAINSMSS
ncbi:hypothetical protein GLYMA_02G022900v4 [Glycine max]|uniref:Uncharacterized protein n=1 Tax=Glycine max TaxID=3847 RepID=A0A0R0KRB9_SOYBN|nr:hypothetical protein GLYMA_02G022900v4 [Glycine max]